MYRSDEGAGTAGADRDQPAQEPNHRGNHQPGPSTAYSLAQFLLLSTQSNLRQCFSTFHGVRLA